MKGRNLGGVYDRLAPEERFQLVLEAAARKDETEVERLADTCPRYRYTSVLNDPAFVDRIKASRQIAFCISLMLMEISAKLMMIRTSQECEALLSRSLITTFDRGYLKGWEAGCEHAWRSADMTGSFPLEGDDLGWRADDVAGTFAGEGGNTNDDDDDHHDDDDDDDGGGSDGGDDDDDESAEGAQALVTEIRTIWEAFSRFCRAEMGVEPESVLLAWVPPMVGWIEGALSAADAVQVDADLLLEYERALTNAWREFLREA